MSCGHPIDAAILADYWLGLAEEEAVAEHLLACDSCGDRLREVMALIEGVRDLARAGSLRMVVSDEFPRRAAKQGLRVRQYSVAAGGKVDCTVGAEDDLLIARLGADLRGAKRVDLCVCDFEGNEQLRLRDIPYDSGAEAVYYQESMVFAKAAPTSRMLVRLVRVDEAGGEGLIGEYAFHHTRTLPGPGGW